MKASAVVMVSGVVVLLCALAGATSIADYEKMSRHDGSELVASFIDKMTTDIREKNPDLAVRIRNWFAVTPEGKELPEGFERLVIELGALDKLAKEGRADLSKIQIESVIVYIVKEKFMPPTKAGK
jgi:soluble cytochrome b562